MDPATLMEAASLAKAVAELTGIIESTDEKIDRLVHAPLGKAVHALRDAGIAAGRDERGRLVNEAAAAFRTAVHQEVGLRRMEAHIGLFVCYQSKAERALALTALSDACAVVTPRERLEAPEGLKEHAARALRAAAAYELNLLRLARGRFLKAWSIEDLMTPSEVRQSETMVRWREAIRRATCNLTDLPGSTDW